MTWNAGTARGFRLVDRGDSSISDTQGRILLANNNGIISALPSYGFTSLPASSAHFYLTHVGNQTRHIYASSLAGNNAASRSGDARSVSEQLGFQFFNAPNTDATRFYGSTQGNGFVTSNTTLTRVRIPYVNPELLSGNGTWPDYTKQFDETSATAYAVVSDAPLVSVGELGHIYDPGYRQSAGAASPITAARGGGRTLKIGQPDDVIGSAARFSATWQNAAWRLTDVFGVSSNRTQVELEPTSRGKININSVGRDGGMALKSLLRNYVFPASPASDAGTAGKILREDNDEINYIVSSVSSYLTSNGPFMERGELSQISFFSGYPNVRTIGSQKVRESADRSREQIFRGLAEMITTRSASFAVYSVGEALQESDTGVIKAIGRAYTGSVYTITPNLPSALRSTPTDFTVKKLYDIP